MPLAYGFYRLGTVRAIPAAINSFTARGTFEGWIRSRRCGRTPDMLRVSTRRDCRYFLEPAVPHLRALFALTWASAAASKSQIADLRAKPRLARRDRARTWAPSELNNGGAA